MPLGQPKKRGRPIGSKTSSSAQLAARIRKLQKQNKDLQQRKLMTVHGMLQSHVRVDLKWHRYFELIDNTLSYNSYDFRLNSMGDPDLTGTGSQPVLHDDLNVMYGRYRVNALTFKITMHNTSQNIVQCSYIINESQDNLAALTTYGTQMYAKSNRTDSKVLNPQGSNGDSVTFYKTVNLYKINPEYSDMSNTGLMNGNPTAPAAAIRFNAQNVNSQTPLAKVICTYECIFHSTLSRVEDDSNVTLD